MVHPNMIPLKVYLLGGGGAAFVTIGTLLAITWSSLVKYNVYQQLKLKEDSESFRLWRDTPVPQEMKFYMFNWLNPEEFGVQKPSFSQMGPYTFTVKEKKTGIIWNNNGTVTFKIQRFWIFDPDKSEGSLEDKVVTLNSVSVSAARTIRHRSGAMRSGLSTTMWFTGEKISVKHTVGEILFFGYKDSLLTIGSKIPAFSDVEIPPYDKFAWFYTRNGSEAFDGTFNMETGVNDIYSIGKLQNWNFNNKTSFYESTCAYVNGSAGEIFPPERTKTSISMYSADLCRSINLSYSNEEVVHGIRGYKYVGDKYTFDNGTLDPSNECFCDGKCSPTGVVNVTRCRYGAPGFISFPHFNLADDFYTDQVEGLKPIPEKHTLYITLEPTTGIPLDVAARFQINLLLEPTSGISLFEDVPTIYFPMIWFEQKVTITEALADEVRLVLRLPFIGQCFSSFLVIVGIVMILLAVYFRLQCTKQSAEKEEEMKRTEGTGEPLMGVEIKEMNKKTAI
ncbi:protein peste [Halyomorpha halys]|uniref:protein peste n=1 Tax=Halyomorpha halys TaxID=286706 RepID=UPI0006D4EC42|nr:protein peste-like [Halyomorpha halys]